MGIAIKGQKFIDGLKKYKHSLLILLIGFILMVIPANLQQSDNAVRHQNVETNEISLEERLSVALSQLRGAGKVEVVLTKAAGEEVIYQTNQDIGNSDSSYQSKNSTVTITDANRNQNGLIKQINPERYQGAIILCQGADDPDICLSLVDAVSKVTGLGANKISVLKMK